MREPTTASNTDIQCSGERDAAAAASTSHVKSSPRQAPATAVVQLAVSNEGERIRVGLGRWWHHARHRDGVGDHDAPARAAGMDGPHDVSARLTYVDDPQTE
jgi:hypothetical protein